MITKKEVQHIAKLARIGITKKDEEKFQKELSSVLEYAAILKKVDVSKVKPTSHPFQIENAVRSDSARREKQKLLTDFLKVKSILK